MHYECSCGFVASSATLFYKHLAASKDSGEGHQLTQARYSDKGNKVPANPCGAVAQSNTASGPPSWVDEYLLVDQRDTGSAHQPSAPPQPRDSHPTLPVSTGAPRAGTAAQPPPPPASAAGEMDCVSLRDMAGASKSWALSKQRSSTAARPPLPSVNASVSASKASPSAFPDAVPSLVDSDEPELVERSSYHRTNGEAPGTSGAGSGGNTAAQAALRMSGTVVNAMVVGLSPWRWFGPGSGGAGAGVGSGALSPAGPRAHGASGDGGGGQTEAEASGREAAGEGLGSLAERLPSGFLAGPRESLASWDSDEPPGSALEAIKAVRDVFIWRHPWHTGRIFGAGLYLAVCVRQLTKGHDLLQPSTALFGLCFLLLVRNVVREGVTNYRRAQQQGAEEGSCSGQDAGGRLAGASPRDEDAERRKAAMQLQQRVEGVLRPIAVGAAHYGAALVVLGAGLLSGRRAITSALVAALLWLGMVLGELRFTSQPMFWLLCYLAVFTIPAAYYRCRQAMDAGVEAALRFVVRVLVSGSRTSLLAAGGVAAVLVAVLPLNFVLRASLAGVAAFGVLLWHFEGRGRGAGACGPAATACGGGGLGVKEAGERVVEGR